MGFFTRPLALLWRHRVLLWQTTRNELRARYAGSVLGMTWLVFYPLLFLGIYTAIYLFVYQVRSASFETPQEFVALVFCGLIPFLGFAESLGSGLPSVSSNAPLIKNTLYPVDLIPAKAVLVSQSTQLVGLGLLVAAVTVMGHLSWYILWLPVVWVLQVMFTLGLIWILSSLNVYLRDLQNVMAVVILMLMVASPIAYTLDMVPERMRFILALNPLYYIITAYQDCVFLGRSPRLLWPLVGLGAGGFWVGHWFFNRMKKVFIDNV
jgi:lipopolysaccharide transport system permease protein